MIPISVRMTGWMRYRDETVADFSSGTLIAICGENGAGKSSIFDAITFALYGQHRLGKMQAAQLISEDRDRLSVEFEFEVGGQRYLVRRSRGKKQGERDQSLWLADGSGEWAQIPGTEKEDALDLAIAKLVRLSHAAFTASFLLQQGEATAFIDSDPKDRFQIISSLIGLKAYEALERAARDATKLEKTKIDWIGGKLIEIGELDEDGVERLRADAIRLAQTEKDAAELLARAKTMLVDAERYARLSDETRLLNQRIARASELLEQKEQIERDSQLFETLNSALDGIVRVQNALADASRAEAVAAEAQREARAIDLVGLGTSHATTVANATTAAKALKIAEGTHASAQTEERAAYEFAQMASTVLGERERLASLESRVAEIDAELKKHSTAGAKLAEGADAARKTAERADAAVETARRAGAAARAKADALKDELSSRKAAAKEATCSRCGQKIDKTAARIQIDELSTSLAQAQTAAASATADEQAAMKGRVAAKKAADDLVAAHTAHAQRASRLDGERIAATTSCVQASSVLADVEAKLDGRLKKIASAESVYVKAQATLVATQTELDSARTQDTYSREVEQKAQEALTDGKQRRSELEGTAREQAAVATGHRTLAESSAGALGELGQQALEDPAQVLIALRRNRESLAEAPKQLAALRTAENEHQTASGERNAKQQEIDAIPAAHQVDVEAAREAERGSEGAAMAAREALQMTQRQLATAEARIGQLAELREDKLRSEARHKHLRKLMTLLGKKGLQGMLVQGALTTITNHANAFLQRLTGGTLELTLERDGDALELKARDLTCMREARSAKALSGSQKFRCAVAIASGIGQYAGAGGMRSIVIDEGFGSLDIEGQKQMVVELKELAQHMDKVIVVSHLEAFSDPVNFPDRLEVRQAGDGASTIARVG